MHEVADAVPYVWRPCAWLGLTGKFFTLGEGDWHLLIQTWVVLGVLALLCLPVRWILHGKHGVLRHLIITYVRTFVDLCKQAMGSTNVPYITFIIALFTFIFVCNTISLVPWMEEPTQNLNTTLALGIVSFIYIQWQGLKVQGVRGYLHEYTEPTIIMAPLHIIGKLASIVSMSFRLFGNIFAGATILALYNKVVQMNVVFEVIGIGPNLILQLFFGLFEGFLQAFVFTMLSLTYLAIATQTEHHA